MALKVGKIYVVFTANTQAFGKSLRDVSKQVEHVAAKIKRIGTEARRIGTELALIGGAAVFVAAKHNKALQSALDSIKRSGERMAGEIGAALLPVVQQLAKGVRELTEWFRGLDPNLKINLARFLAITAGVLLAIGAIGKLAAAVKAIASTFSLIGSLLGTGALLPILAIIAAIAVVIGIVAALRKAWVTNLGGMRDTLTGVADTVIADFNATLAVLGSLLSGVKNFIVWIVSSTIDAITTLGDGFFKVLRGMLDMSETVGKALHMDFGQFAAAGKGLDALQGVYESAKGIGAKLKASMDGSAAIDKAKIIGHAIGKAVKEGASWELGALKDLGASVLKGLGLTGGHAALASGGPLNGQPTDKQAAQVAWGQLLGVNKMTGLHVADLLRVVTSYADGKRRDALRVHSNRIGGGFSSGFGGAASAAVGGGMGAPAAAIGAFDFTPIKAALKTLADRIVSAGGVAGDTIKAAMSGFASGGPGGALMGAITSLLEHSVQFQQILAIVSQLFQMVANALGMILTPLEPLLGAIFNVVRAIIGGLAPAFKLMGSILTPFVPIVQLLANVLSAFAPIIAIVAQAFVLISEPLLLVAGPILHALFDVLKFVGVIILQIVLAIAPVWNGIVGAVEGVVNALANITIDLGPLGKFQPFAFMQSWGQSLEGAKINTDALGASLKALQNSTWDSTTAQAANTAATLAGTAAMNQATESLTNVPEGFKVAAARFSSIIAGMGAYGGQGITGASALGSPGYGLGSATDGSGIPHLAAGGIVSRPTIALIGESGPEAVTPLGKGGGGSTFVINVYASDPREAARQVVAEIQRSKFVHQASFSRPF